jgi:hypothetical protein
MPPERNIKNNLTQAKSGDNNNTLTDFDICELFIKCVEVFATTASRLEMERGAAVTLGKELWKETIETLKQYRKSIPLVVDAEELKRKI